MLRDENENFLFSISCFETRTRNRKSFLMVEREKIKLILTRIPGIENSRYALSQVSRIALRQSIARILDPGNSRENQLDFFSLDHEK